MEALQIISVLFLVLSLGLYLYKGQSASFLMRFLVGVFSFISIFFVIFFFVANHMTGRGISSSVFYYLQFGIKGAGTSEYYGLIALIVFILFLSIGLCVWLVRKKTEKNASNKLISIVVFSLILSILTSPVTISFGKYYKNNIFDFTLEDVPDFNEFYVNPHLQKNSKTRNFVLIYAESLERTYFDEEKFPGLIENLKEIENKSISFQNVYQDEVSHHTIGGLVASMCGIPLISDFRLNLLNELGYYLGGTDCFSDLLFENGYDLSFLGGADLGFSGKGNFFKTHQFQNLKGLNEMTPLVFDPLYRNNWGYFDDTVFDLAYEEYRRLVQSENNFGLVLLTLDTHHPNGFISNSCKGFTYGDGKNPILNAVKCSDYLISDFVRKIRASGLDKNTVIIIASDHLAMNNTAIDELNELDRKILFMVNTPENTSGIIKNYGLSLDIGASILPFIGFIGEIGFGKDISKISESEKRKSELLQALPHYSSKVLKFWDFPLLKEKITLNPLSSKVILDKREFSMPILISFDEKFQTDIFNKDETRSDSFQKTIEKLNLKNYILIDDCGFSKADKSFCLTTGNPEFPRIEIIEETEFGIEEISKLIGF